MVNELKMCFFFSRIHVERAIERLKTFGVLQFLEEPLYKHINNILIVLAYVCNNMDPLIKIKESKQPDEILEESTLESNDEEVEALEEDFDFENVMLDPQQPITIEPIIQPLNFSEKHKKCAESKDEIKKMKVTELKAALKSRGLSCKGLKSELISRLEEHFDMDIVEDSESEVQSDTISEPEPDLSNNYFENISSDEEVGPLLHKKKLKSEEIEAILNAEPSASTSMPSASSRSSSRARKKSKKFDDYVL